MNDLSCPYCGNGMRPITSAMLNGIKAYFKCDNCNSRGPRIKQPYIGDDHYGVAKQTYQHTTDAAIELARSKTIIVDVMTMEIPEIDSFDSVLN